MLRNDSNYRNFINGNEGYNCCNSCKSCPPKPCPSCCAGPTGPQGPAGQTGVRGPTGAAGATILDSYETYAELVAEHPTGTAGDAYIAGGELYVWNAETSTWRNMGSLVGPTGPTGPTGAAGATILGSYETYAELVNAHPTGTVGDAYLAGGELYVWGGEPASWQSMGSLIGPTGAAGATILDSYETYAELVNAHPTGTVGDAYLAGGELYVWGGDPAAWQNMGSLIGPTGPTGATGAGIEVLGVYATLAGLIADHPTGNPGDAYVVDGVIYVWDTASMSWEAAGSVGATGPTGATGAGIDVLGVYETLAGLIAAHPTGNPGDAYVVDGIIYIWDTETMSWKAAGSVGAPGPEASSYTIIPFASQQAPLVTTNNGGMPTNAALIGFGYMSNADIGVDIDPNDRSFNLTLEANRQVAFSLPFDMKLNSIYITVGTWEAFAIPPTGTLVYPYVQVYAAEAGTNNFFPIANAFAKPELGIDPQSAAAATMRFASKDGLDIGLRAGTRIAICGMMEITGDTLFREYYLYYTGGIGMTRWVE